MANASGGLEGARARTWGDPQRDEIANDHDGWNPGPDACDGLLWKDPGLGPDGWRRADQALRDRIVAHLLQDRILDAKDIAVLVDDGVVVLSGCVRHASDLRLAEMLTREVCPEAEVVNRLLAPAP
jgi:hypothetical protein